MRYKLCEDISFVNDHDKLVILDFESGDYYVAEGVCADIISYVNDSLKEEEDILIMLNGKYDSQMYDIVNSFQNCMKELIQLKIICCN